MNGIPSLADFQLFIQNVMGVPVAYLPPTDPIIGFAYGWALDIANDQLSGLPSPAQNGQWSQYELAIYNLAAHGLIEFANDQSFPITALSWASPGIATASLASPSPLAAGQVVQVSGCSPIQWNTIDQNGALISAVVLSVPDSQHFTYAVPLQPTTPTAFGNVGYTLFQNTRTASKMGQFAPGVVSSSGDVGTSASLLNPEFFKNLTLMDLQLVKTIYGRRYLTISQAYGPTIWALS
jgi:hypothetical protein